MKSFRFTLGIKITLLALTGVLFLSIVGVFSISAVNILTDQGAISTTEDIKALELLNSLRVTQVAFQSQVQEWKDILLRGNDPELYSKYSTAFEKRSAEVDQFLLDMRKQTQGTEFLTEEVDNLLAAHAELNIKFNNALKTYNFGNAAGGQAVDKLVRGMNRDTLTALEKLSQGIVSVSVNTTITAKQHLEAQASRTKWLIIVALSLTLPLLMLMGVFITRGIIRNLNSFQQTIININQGDFNARAQIKSNDELGVLAKAFNDLLDSRIATMLKIEKENEQLNESVLTLLQAVAQMSKKDLTVKVPVNENITGAVADALNLFTSETAKVMLDVNNISADVTKASIMVQAKADAMLAASQQGREEVDRTAVSLASAAQSMSSIANLAQGCNTVADNAMKSTQEALNAVNSTVIGINSTRDVIRETEKRIKRLGERSQEISGVVNLINVIAERTHILALNASMHAASAGEAGRGFAVVADEVQRLAENARQATQQISALVNNIQLETSDTVNTMNSAITQIVEGSRLAEQAGQQMQLTQQNTAKLVDSVKQIASTTESQSKAGQTLLDNAVQIKKSSQQATDQLHEQATQTSNLLDYAKQLLTAVRVFKLPA